MTPQTYFWVTGTRGNGQSVMDGPHFDQGDADDIAAELNGAQVHALPTRNHQRAKQLLAGRGTFDPNRNNRMHTDEPEEDGDTVFDRIRRFMPQRREKNEEEEF